MGKKHSHKWLEFFSSIVASTPALMTFMTLIFGAVLLAVAAVAVLALLVLYKAGG